MPIIEGLEDHQKSERFLLLEPDEMLTIGAPSSLNIQLIRITLTPGGWRFDRKLPNTSYWTILCYIPL